MKHVLIVGGGFAGLNAAKVLGNYGKVKVTLIDRNNYHLFQPLLYQVAMAGLSPAEIAAPIRSILSKYQNITVYQRQVTGIDANQNKVFTNYCEHDSDYLILACGSLHSYFGNDYWEDYAPGLKTIEQATEIRRRVLTAFEQAECETDNLKRKKLLTFLVIGAGPTGVELAGALGEMTRFTLAKDFRNIDPTKTQIILIEAGPRILPTFSEELASKAARYLQNLGVQIRTLSFVSNISSDHIVIGNEKIEAATILWAAGVQAIGVGNRLNVQTDKQGRIFVEPDLSIKGYPNIFVAGDQAHFDHQTGQPLPGLAPVAVQQGRFIARNIIREIEGKPRQRFYYHDKGQLATIGKNRAIVQTKYIKSGGRFAWWLWLIVHIFYLIGFKNRIFVILDWAWSYITFEKGARLIVPKNWKSFNRKKEQT